MATKEMRPTRAVALLVATAVLVLGGVAQAQPTGSAGHSTTELDASDNRDRARARATRG